MVGTEKRHNQRDVRDRPMADIAEFEQVATASFALASIARFSASLSKEKTTRQERDDA
jgi:hypothetical protein